MATSSSKGFVPTKLSKVLSIKKTTKLADVLTQAETSRPFEESPNLIKEIEQIVIPSQCNSLVVGSRKKQDRVPLPYDSGQDKRLKLLTYRKTLRALLSPMSKATGSHQFETLSLAASMQCFQCQENIVPLTRQGVRCLKCGVKCHQRCSILMNADCNLRVAERIQSPYASSLDVSASSTNDNAAKRVSLRTFANFVTESANEKNELIELVRQIFGIKEETHVAELASAIDLECAMANWQTKLRVTVKSAHGIYARKSNGTSNPYVTLQFGQANYRTASIFKTLNPKWNETFQFQCENIMEGLKVRVWDQSEDAPNPEKDDFLGQCVLNVAKLHSGTTELSCDLEKRTERSKVSGFINLAVQLPEGEDSNEDLSPNKIYQFLHEEIFKKLYSNRTVISGDGLDAVMCKEPFEGHYQTIIDSFSDRFAIDSAFMTTVHASCMAQIVHITGAAVVLQIWLGKIFDDHISEIIAEPFRLVTTVKRLCLDTFLHMLDRIERIILFEIADYRNSFPAEDSLRLLDLTACCQILRAVSSYHQQVAGAIMIVGDGRNDFRSSFVEEALQEANKRTYQFIFNNCIDLYHDNYESDQTVEHVIPGSNPDYWHKFISLIAQALEADLNVYEKRFYNFPNIQLSTRSAFSFWEQLIEDVSQMLIRHHRHKEVKNSSSEDYIRLYFKIQWFHARYISVLPDDLRARSSKYPKWFEPFVYSWLADSSEKYVDLVNKACWKDKCSAFQQYSDETTYSHSAYDIFSPLAQCYQILRKIDWWDPEVKIVNAKVFGHTVHKVIKTYYRIVEEDYESQLGKQPLVACRLLNNIQQTSSNLKSLKSSMSEYEATYDTAIKTIEDLLDTLKVSLERLCSEFVHSLSGLINEKVKDMGSDLRRLSGRSLSPEQIQKHAETIVKPLIDHLESEITFFADKCDDSMLKTMLRHLWRKLVLLIEETIVFPKVTEPRILRNWVPKLNKQQCLVLSAVVEKMKHYLHADCAGLPKDFLDNCPNGKVLLLTLSMYCDPTNLLMKTYVKTQWSRDTPSVENIGLINVRIARRRNSWFGDDEVVDVTVIDTKFLRQPFPNHPFVIINLIGPSLSVKWRTRYTRAIPNLLSPIFHELLTLKTSKRHDLADYELQFTVKDYRVGAFSDASHSTIGIAVVKLVNIESGIYTATLPLATSIQPSLKGRAVLKILASRQGDSSAKRFIRIKSAANVQRINSDCSIAED